MAIQNRYEFLFYIQTVNANPNGDPDMGNLPRMDPQDSHGYITDGAIKRRIRNYIQQAYAGQPGMNIFVRSQSNLNTAIAAAKEAAGVPVMSKEKADVNKGRDQACRMYYDVRSFGAVMSTGPNAGQVRGPIQLTFARSIDPIEALDISITRMATADNAGGAKTLSEFEEWEAAHPSRKGPRGAERGGRRRGRAARSAAYAVRRRTSPRASGRRRRPAQHGHRAVRMQDHRTRARR